jgi:glycosyltransferase involved in cell wall biosynthesis
MDNAKTLLFLHPTSDHDDADVALLDLVRGIDRAHWRPVVALHRDGPLSALLRAAGAVVELGPLGVLEHRTLRSPLGLIRFALQLPRALRFVRRLVQRHRPALVHTSTSSVVGGALGARLSGARHLWQLHGSGDRPEWATRALHRLSTWLADVVVSDSRAAQQSLGRHSPKLAARRRVVHPGVDRRRLDLDRLTRAAARRSLEVREDSTLIVAIGPIDAWGGHALLIEAAERLRLQHPDTEFLLVGDAPRGAGQRVVELHAELERRNLLGYVRHLPHQSDRARVLVAADIVVLPATRPEDFPLVAAEALACARPVVAAAHGAVVEVVDPESTGLVFEPGDPEELAWALQVLVEDRALAQEMGQRGAASHAERFSSERVARDMHRLWSQVVSGRLALAASETKIVHFVLGALEPDRLDAVEHGVHHLASAQTARGLDVTVLALSAAPEASASPRPYAFQRLHAASHPSELTPELRAAVDALPPTSVVHLHGGFLPTMHALGAALVRRRLPYVVTPHGAYRALARKRGGVRLFVYTWLKEWRLLRRARAVQAFSARERLEMAGLVDLAKVVVAPSGQNALRMAPTLDTAGIRRPLYGYCGPLGRGVDGVESLVQAFGLHTAGGRDGTLWLFGGGDDRPRLEAIVHDLGLARRVAFDGECFGTERLARLQALDVLVQPSGREGESPSTLEAAALGRAVVVTSDTGLGRELRQHGAGFVLEHADPEQLAAALSACEREWRAGTLAKRGASARALIAAHFAWSRVEPRVCRDLYQLDDAGLTPRSHPAPEPQGVRTESGNRRESA